MPMGIGQAADPDGQKVTSVRQEEVDESAVIEKDPTVGDSLSGDMPADTMPLDNGSADDAASLETATIEESPLPGAADALPEALTSDTLDTIGAVALTVPAPDEAASTAALSAFTNALDDDPVASDPVASDIPMSNTGPEPSTESEPDTAPEADAQPVDPAVAAHIAAQKSNGEERLTAGQMLGAARGAMGLSLEKISARINVPVARLVAIEEMATDQLPAPSFTLGFVRSYARVVGVPAGPLADRYRAEAGYPAKEDISKVAIRERRDLGRRRPTSLPVVMLFFCLALYLAWQMIQTEAPSGPLDLAAVDGVPTIERARSSTGIVYTVEAGTGRIDGLPADLPQQLPSASAAASAGSAAAGDAVDGAAAGDPARGMATGSSDQSVADTGAGAGAGSVTATPDENRADPTEAAPEQVLAIPTDVPIDTSAEEAMAVAQGLGDSESDASGDAAAAAVDDQEAALAAEEALADADTALTEDPAEETELALESEVPAEEDLTFDPLDAESLNRLQLRGQDVAAALGGREGPDADTAASDTSAPATPVLDTETAPPERRSARVQFAVEPVYPSRCVSSAQEVETVTIRFGVSRSGKVLNPAVANSSNSCFDGAAVAAVSRWDFIPATENGAAVSENGRTTRVSFRRP